MAGATARATPSPCTSSRNSVSLATHLKGGRNKVPPSDSRNAVARQNRAPVRPRSNDHTTTHAHTPQRACPNGEERVIFFSGFHHFYYSTDRC